MLFDWYEPDLALAFIWISILVFYFLIRSLRPEGAGKKKRWIAGMSISAWLGFTALLALKGVFQDFHTILPRLFIILAPLLLLILLFSFRTRNLDSIFNMEMFMWIHLLRVFVEIVLFGLYLDKQIPEIMTFSGFNFDILSGLTAPVIWWLYYRKKYIGKKTLLAWNIASLLLLVNIVTVAVLSTPTSFQKFGLDQPNVAVAFFPFIWLPCFVVPAVLFSHLVSIRILLKSE